MQKIKYICDICGECYDKLVKGGQREWRFTRMLSRLKW